MNSLIHNLAESEGFTQLLLCKICRSSLALCSEFEPSHYKMLHRSILLAFDALLGSNPFIINLAESEGFEPPWVAPNGFQDRRVMTTSLTLHVVWLL